MAKLNNENNLEENESSLPSFANYSSGVIQRLLNFLDQTGRDLIQSNGQRRYGPPANWTGPPPPRGSEIFVGKLPRDVFEDELVPAFEKIGPVYEMRLMMDFNGFNRGYGFVKYCKVESAHRAVLLMDDYEIRPGKRIGVSKSVDNCRLFVGNIHLTKQADDVKEELMQYVEGIVRVIMYPCLEDKTKNRGFVFVEFENHRLAAMARRILKSGGVALWGQQIVVDWAEPEPEVDPKIMNKIRKLYIRNLDADTTEEQLQQILERLTCPTDILRVKKVKDYAFVHFKTRASAELVLMELQDFVINGNQLEVTWARPPMYSKNKIALPEKMSLCLSLPPRLRNMNKVAQTNAPSTTTCVSTVPTYFCVRPPQLLYSYPTSGASSLSTVSPSDSPNRHSFGQQSPPIPPITVRNGNNIIGQPPINQTYCLSERMQNLYLSPPAAAPPMEHPYVQMPLNGPMRFTTPFSYYYPLCDRT